MESRIKDIMQKVEISPEYQEKVSSKLEANIRGCEFSDADLCLIAVAYEDGLIDARK